MSQFFLQETQVNISEAPYLPEFYLKKNEKPFFGMIKLMLGFTRVGRSGEVEGHWNEA